MLSMDSTSNLADTLSSLPETNRIHSAKVLALMNEHRKECSKLCDLVLTAGDVNIPAHRSVLAACSPYFYAMFTGELMESKQRIVNLQDVQPQMLEVLIEFAYTGNLDVTEENVQPLLALASLIHFPEVREICCKFLESQLDPSNCLGIRKFAETHGCHRFLEHIDKYVLDHFKDILHSDEYSLMPYDLLCKHTSSDNINVNSEKEIYEGVLKWVRHDLPERGHLLPNLLAHVRLPLLPVQYLLEEVDNEHLIRVSLTCRDFLDEAKNYHLRPDKHQQFRSVRTRPRKSTTGTLYAVGGKEAGETITRKVECYSMQTDKWHAVAPLNTPRQQLGVCELKGRLFAVGGSDGYIRLDSVEVFSEEAKRWTYMKSLNTCRSGVGVCAIGNTLYALGGYDGRLCLNTVERYDSELDIWHYVAPTIVTRSFPGVAHLDGRIYVAGGNDGSSFLSSCEVFDPMTNKWSFLAPMQRPRAGVGADVLDGMLYVAGGFDGVSRLDSVEVYDPRMNAWTQIGPMSSARDGVCMRKYGSWLFAVGGIDGPSYLNSVEYYDPKEDRWEEIIPMLTSRAAAGVAIMPANSELQ